MLCPLRNGERVTFTINGKLHKAGEEVGTTTSLNTFIRENAGLKGTKYMCKEGGCGACVVLLTSLHPATGEEHSYAVNSCLVPVLSCEGMEVTTIEGLGDKKRGYHRVVKTLAAFNGTQCGYCSPAMVMLMYSLLKSSPSLTVEEVENSFGGNICRCTGYRPILDAFKSLTVESSSNFCDIEELGKLCGRLGRACREKCEGCPGDKGGDAPSPAITAALHGGRSWYRVSRVDHIFQLFDYIGSRSYMIVAGNTAQGVYKEAEPEVYIDITLVGELRDWRLLGDHLDIGANLTLTEAMTVFRKVAAKNRLLFGYLDRLADHIDLVANVPVRNRATLAGNLMIKHRHREFPSDIFLIFQTCKALITLRDTSGNEETVPIIEFLEYNMYKRLILSFTLPALSSNHYLFRSFKIMPRRQNVHAYVNAGFLFRFQWKNQCIVEETPNIVFGNIEPNFVHAYQTQDLLRGKSLMSEPVLRDAVHCLAGELRPHDHPPEASPIYRQRLAIGLFYKFILGVNGPNASQVYQSGGSDLERPLSSGTQTFPVNTKENPAHQPVPKVEGLIQCSGEAEYVDDIPPRPGQLYGALVITDRARTKIVAIDPTPATEMHGVVAFFSAKDIPGINTFVTIDGLINSSEEELFCSGEVLYAGQPVGMVVAECQELADRAAAAVKIRYSELIKPLLTVKEVLASGDKARLRPFGKITPTGSGGKVAHKLTGEVEMGSQYHYTMELQTCLVVPLEDGLDVFSSTQWMHNTQAAIARALDLPLNCINVHVRRVGGAYGAKITRSMIAAGACALAAHRLQCPVRMVLDLQTNMKAIGKRYPTYSKYEVKVGVDEVGKIQNLSLQIYEDCGCSFNDNVIIFTRDGVKNCYDFSNWTVNFFLVKTDKPSNTWTRAPGSLEGMTTIEHIMEHIATVCKTDPLQVRLINVQPAEKMEIQEIVQEVLDSSDYEKRTIQIHKFNIMNRWMKRGISVMPMKFDLIFFPGFHSMVSIFYDDGTVAIVSGGIEIGQGINTKVIQVAAYELGIDMSMIKIKPCYNVISPNDKPSSTSITSDTITYATLQCCRELNRRLQPIRDRMKDLTWKQLLRIANQEGVDLNASYMYTLTDPVPNPYPVYGATVLEVEVDIITGQYQILRVDILEDAGESLSPLIDIGQIEGAFVMGLGYFSSEKIVHHQETGELLTPRTWLYWPPGAKDIPIDFRVTMKKNATNPRGVLRSKATGEPPLCMSVSLVMALREALFSARRDAGLPDDWFTFNPPCTFENTALTAGTSLEHFKL